MANNWIKGAIKHPGSLHRLLGVPEGKKIPGSKMQSALHSTNPQIKKKAILAKTLSSFKK